MIEDDVLDCLNTVCAILNHHQVENIIFGGAAVNY